MNNVNIDFLKAGGVVVMPEKSYRALIREMRDLQMEAEEARLSAEDAPKKAGSISLDIARVSTWWKVEFGLEPLRKIKVEMTYDDLAKIVDLLEREEK